MFLKKTFKNKSGRNSKGSIVVRGRGGGVKRSYRSLDLLRSIWFQRGRIIKLEYDPNRSAPLALVKCVTMQIFFYIIKSEGVEMNSIIQAYPAAKTLPGNSLILKNIPTGLFLNNLEIYKNQGSQFARAAGSFCQIVKKSKRYVVLKLRSKNLKKVSNLCFATIGRVSINFFIIKRAYKGAGRNRLKNWRPQVRGVAMNPVDHPHGGGKGKKSSKAISMSPWGKLIKGKKTRKKHNEVALKRYIRK